MKKIKHKLDKEEQELFDSLERGEWRTVKNFNQEKAKAEKMAKNTLKKLSADGHPNYKLDKEEQEILDSYERGEWRPVKNSKEWKIKAKKIAENTMKRLAKDARINIRIKSMDLERIKAIAEHDGLPYQTLIASVLHQFAQGRLQRP